MFSRFRAAFLVLAVLTAGSAFGHDPGLSTVEATWTGGELVLAATFSGRDAQLLQASQSGADGQLWRVAIGQQAIVPVRVTSDALPGDNVRIMAVYRVPSAAPQLEIVSVALTRLPTGHRQFFYVANGSEAPAIKKLLSAADDRIAIPPPAATGTMRGDSAERLGLPSARPALRDGERAVDPSNRRAGNSMPTFLGFLVLGIEHIWTGYDHILFLFGLLVVCRTFRSVLTVISCFTLAHSATLAFATLGIVNLPTGITEPAIAASIVFVGIENLLRRGAEPRSRWAVTFAFGLIHGFGFASVLRDLGVGASGAGLAVPLFSFNLGVEIGQIAIAGVMLPLLWRVRRSERAAVFLAPATSAAIAIAGAYWFTERVLVG